MKYKPTYSKPRASYNNIIHVPDTINDRQAASVPQVVSQVSIQNYDYDYDSWLIINSHKYIALIARQRNSTHHTTYTVLGLACQQ